MQVVFLADFFPGILNNRIERPLSQGVGISEGAFRSKTNMQETSNLLGSYFIDMYSVLKIDSYPIGGSDGNSKVLYSAFSSGS